MPSPTSPSQALGRVVRALRQEQGLSQEALGRRASLVRTHVGLIERGEIDPAYGVVVRLAAALQLDAADLVARAEAERGRSSE